MSEKTIVSTDHDIDLSGRRLFARRWEPPEDVSGRPTIVLFHDSLGCVETWRDFPALLAASTKLPVVAYDRLGFGRSDVNPARLDRDFMENEARTGFAAVKEQLALDRFVAFGHSAGGGMAIATAALFQDACVAVITEAAQSFAEEQTLEGIRQAKIQFASPEQMDRLERYHGAKALWVLEAWTETWLSPDFAAWTLDALLAKVICPLLAIHGEQDEFGTFAHLERISARSAGLVEAVGLNGCGHVPHRHAQAELIKLVERFVASHVEGQEKRQRMEPARNRMRNTGGRGRSCHESGSIRTDDREEER